MGCNHNFVTYQNCGESNVTASKTSEAKVSNQLRNGSHGRSQAPQRPNVRYSTRIAGGRRRYDLWGALHGRGRGLAPGYHWRLIGMVFCGCFVFWRPVVLVVILLPFRWLQILCASWVLSKLTGEPPRLNGMISSSSQLSGCGVLSVRSMGLPQSAQIGIGPSAAMCLALHLRRAAPLL